MKLSTRIPALALALGVGLQAQAGDDILYQVSTIDALLAGVYEPVAQVGEVMEHGDFGLGTFEALDGEAILFEGQIYQAASDGTVRLMPETAGTPFMAVTHFDRDLALTPPAGQTFSDFKDWLEAALPSRNIAYAIRVDGHFDRVRYRSVPRQTPPYPPLAEAAKSQTFFERKDISGTLVGFWCPAYTKGVNVPGFHLHFLSEDRQHAGHLLDFVLTEGQVALDLTDDWSVDLPMDPSFLDADLESDRSQALHQVEQGKPAD
ncbi:acetolactate decarboxylase [Imhoffiella purpurea]|uniref:Alpha-acetolactate decarboxylase n=1 Tax=Imhoffiella purpurea TaxID=1249627 RepID=W9VE25_9GAMM|nr:acetolactate decarboxylase [Imhoffiella purpurea]EXJ14297.1 Alpha-acetolactate decarboxylase [Imhoffiella purpurea]